MNKKTAGGKKKEVQVKLYQSYQCEIRRPSPARIWHIDGKDVLFGPGYFYDIIWIERDVVEKGIDIIEDGTLIRWTIHEVYGFSKMPRQRKTFKRAE